VSILVVGSVALDTVETPFARIEETLGGAASYFVTAASLYSQVNLVAIIGSDFPREHLDFWGKRPVNLAGLKIEEGSTFRWAARYHMDMNTRDTLDTQLGVYAGFHPVIPEEYRSSTLLFLANIQPELQLEVLEQVSDVQLSVLDTMELWIMTARSQLTEVIKRVDMLLMSEEEVRQYTNRASLVAGVRQLLDMGLQYVVVKQGSYGALLFCADGTFFSAPAYPLEEVIDPTGAGDAFAGGLLGYLATVEPEQAGHYSFDEIKRGVVHGNIIGSFVCEDFSIDRLRSLAMDDIAERYQCLVMCSHFDPNWRSGEPGQAQTMSRRGEPDTRKGYHYISPVKSSLTKH
jgi:sugar/nucleoside kinase (ribokinase family)